MREYQRSLVAKADFPESQMVIAGTALVLRNLLAAEHAFAEAVTLDPQLTRAWCNRPVTPPYLTTYGYREGRREVLRIHGPRCVDAVKPRTVMSSIMRTRNGLIAVSVISNSCL